MYEELLMAEEGLKDTANTLIHIGKPLEFDRDEFENKLPELYEISEEHPEAVKKAVSEIVKTYNYRESVTN